MKKTERKSQTSINRAKDEVKGFRTMFAKLQQKLNLGGPIRLDIDFIPIQSSVD